MRKDRLLALADFLEKLPPERFDYGHWVGRDWKGAPDLSCGTTACAMGWAAQVPELKECGLSYVRLASGSVYVTDGVSRDPYEVAICVFDLTPRGAEYLFTPDVCHPHFEDPSPSDDATAAEVAAHIRKFVEASS